MKVLIVSDTHRQDRTLEEVLKKEKPIDYLIHLGDAEGSEEYIQTLAECPAYMVSGNNDFFSDLPKEREFMLGKDKVFITHGHYYYVTLNLNELIRQANAKDSDIVMFGHTHRPLLKKRGNLVIVNPGSLSYPRQEGKKPSYIIMESDEMGNSRFEIKYLT